MLIQQQRAEIYEKLIKHAQSKLSKEVVKLLTDFIPKYYANVAVEDITERDIVDLYGELLSHWHFLYDRAPGETRVRVYNPQYEKNGWQSKHTIIEIAHDNVPFLVDSTRLELNRRGLTIHLCIHTGGMKVLRNGKNQIVQIFTGNNLPENYGTEAPILFEVDRITDNETLDDIKKNLENILAEVDIVVVDWVNMRERMEQCIEDLTLHSPDIAPLELEEYKEVLRYLHDNHLTLLGVREYKLTIHDKNQVFEMADNSSLGILKDETRARKYRYFDSLPEAAQQLLLSQQPVIFTKRSKLARVHRSDYLDRIEVKHFDQNKKVIGVTCFLGLFTSSVFNSRPKDIPLLRTKVAQIFANSQLEPTSHGGKELLNILETLPRDDLFYSTVEELTTLSQGILYIQERKRVKMFLRRDIYCRFVSVLVYIPRDRFDSDLRQKIQDLLAATFNAKQITFNTQFSESILARVHFLIHVEPENFPEYDEHELESKIAELAELWSDCLRKELVEIFGEEVGNTYADHYSMSFPAGYMEDYSPRTGAYDISHLEQVNENSKLSMNLYRPLDAVDSVIQFKIFGFKDGFPLSDILPILENMGLKVIGERPYVITPKNRSSLMIIDFSLYFAGSDQLDLEKIKDIFQEAFANIWANQIENDGFNRLVLSASLNYREVSVIRAYSKYLGQIWLTFSQSYIENAISNHPLLAKKIIELFLMRFDPVLNQSSTLKRQEEIEKQILQGLDAVPNFDEDRIIRRFLEIIKATLRTNYFQAITEGQFKSYLSFKFDPHAIIEIPLPRPKYEIFVYSPRFEGVHLRAAKVARGGLRWSDRREDFRTEILGLMKAQHVKNSVIVPGGAKGGFVLKALSADADRDEIQREVVSCYQNFIRGLLDLTDNLHGDMVMHPANTIFYDDNDPYLVVAADKGTATFSDIANGVSAEYQFWLGDAFASGGSAGYDHKEMAITARGAWECVKRHFRQYGINPETTDFTMMGIGDMSGDVFGNGALLSKHMKVVAAFDHRDIFIDPNPDPEKSFQERQRLFHLPRSSWADYAPELISKGGGVFKRTAKSVKLSPEIKALLDLTQDEISTNDLIKAILKARVDLLWNGGIGTFVKATNERHLEVGDRTNDGIRINGFELRCRIVGEGGNLGFTQLGRVEYEMNGGLINTDFIDNSGGVDCSDREVNSKILLNRIIEEGDLTLKQRNELLVELTDEVACLVLRSNYAQAQAISLAALQVRENPELYIRYISYLEEEVKLDRALEFLPDEKTLNDRKLQGKVLTRPEISVLLAYTKIYIKRGLLSSKVLEDPDLIHMIVYSFPKKLSQLYSKQMLGHRLKREIIANVLSNDLVNHMGLTFVYRLGNETGCEVSEVVKAYLTAVKIFGFHKIWHDIEQLDEQVPLEIQEKMMISIVRMIRRATRWLLRNRHTYTDVSATVDYFSESVQKLYEQLNVLLQDIPKQVFDAEYQEMVDHHTPIALAQSVASARMMSVALDLIEEAKNREIDLIEFAKFYFMLGVCLEIPWLRRQLNVYLVQNQWESMAIATLRDDLDWRQRVLVSKLLEETTAEDTPEIRIEKWVQARQSTVRRWHSLLNEMRSSLSQNLVMYGVALRELSELNQPSLAPEKTRKKNKVK